MTLFVGRDPREFGVSKTVGRSHEFRNGDPGSQGISTRINSPLSLTHGGVLLSRPVQRVRGSESSGAADRFLSPWQIRTGSAAQVGPARASDLHRRVDLVQNEDRVTVRLAMSGSAVSSRPYVGVRLSIALTEMATRCPKSVHPRRKR